MTVFGERAHPESIMHQAVVYWNWLVRPHPRLHEEEERHGARLFSSMLLAHIFLVIVGLTAINLYYINQFNRSIWGSYDSSVALFGVLIKITAYLLIRQSFYRLGVCLYIIDVAVVALIIPFVPTANAEIALLAAAALPILLTAIAFSYRRVIAVAVGVLFIGAMLLNRSALPVLQRDNGMVASHNSCDHQRSHSDFQTSLDAHRTNPTVPSIHK